MHEMEGDDGEVSVAWEDLPDVEDFPCATLEDVSVGDLTPVPIVLAGEDDDG